MIQLNFILLTREKLNSAVRFVRYHKFNMKV